MFQRLQSQAQSQNGTLLLDLGLVFPGIMSNSQNETLVTVSLPETGETLASPHAHRFDVLPGRHPRASSGILGQGEHGTDASLVEQ